jgi:hypothetical protein
VRGRLALAAAMVAAAVLAGACGGPTPVVGNGSVSACYRAIPVGRTALHDPKARLIGVHHVPLDYVRSRLPAYARTELARENDTGVCVMAFQGSFAPGQVTLAPSGQHGPYAVVVVSSRKLRLVAAVVLGHLPHAFGGRTL